MTFLSAARITVPVLASVALVATSAVGASAQVSGSAPAAPTAVTCSAKGLPGRVQVVRGQSAVNRRVARTIFAQAVRCDSAALVKRATKDKTRLSFGLVTPKEYFALPDQEQRYAALARALASTQPAYEKQSRSYVWPRVSLGGKHDTPAAWREVVRAGLLTQKEADQMRREGIGYYGYRVAVSDKGQWQSFIAGD